MIAATVHNGRPMHAGKVIVTTAWQVNGWRCVRFEPCTVTAPNGDTVPVWRLSIATPGHPVETLCALIEPGDSIWYDAPGYTWRVADRPEYADGRPLYSVSGTAPTLGAAVRAARDAVEYVTRGDLARDLISDGDWP